MNPKCLRCGQDGHFAQECKLPVLPDDRVLAVPMKQGFMCATAFLHELGEASGGVTVYSDIEDLKANRPCWEQCGIIEVGIVGKEGGNV